MKQHLIIGTRKTHKYTENFKISDFLVPWTSSGCSAVCLYCYLVCNFNKCSYLRVFTNREQMMDKLVKFSVSSGKEMVFEVGSNSDLILENIITENLPWTIEEFAKCGQGKITFPTKFRMSVNPDEIIRNIEIGTSPLDDRIEATNKMCEAGYSVGLLIAPIVMVEVIFMTYSSIHRMINSATYPNSPDLYSFEKMVGCGMGKYIYRKERKENGEIFLREEITKRFPQSKIAYFC